MIDQSICIITTTRSLHDDFPGAFRVIEASGRLPVIMHNACETLLGSVSGLMGVYARKSAGRWFASEVSGTRNTWVTYETLYKCLLEVDVCVCSTCRDWRFNTDIILANNR